MICAPIVNDTIAIENGKYNPMNHNYNTKVKAYLQAAQNGFQL
jgi:hypothetical protein